MCMNTDRIKVVINEYGAKREFFCRSGRRLSDLLRSEGINIHQPCGGEGRCGGCRVRFVSGAPESTAADHAFLAAKELSEGVRLLCRAVPKADCEILLEGERQMAVETTKVPGAAAAGKVTGAGAPTAAVKPEGIPEAEKFAVAVDIGTTTIAAAMVELGEGSPHVAGTLSCANHQNSYGAYVVSRIAAAQDPKAFENMRDIVRRDVEGLIKGLAAGRTVSEVVVAGNTTMLGLLAGESIEGLGTYPYTPAFLDERRYDSRRLFEDITGAEVVLMPGISAFVGADILSGLYYLDILREPGALFIDLGTNGEMAFRNGVQLLVASAAAGPVFEGGGISCGMPSVEGAISHVKIDDDTYEVRFETIFGAPAAGLCGTGVMEAVSELVRTGICDSTGLLSEGYFDEGFPVAVTGQRDIRITQQDIRNVQLGKAAIFAGITALTSGRVPERVYVAGGFGTHIDPDGIKNLRLFPDGFNDKIISSGNTSLQGAIRYAAACLEGGSAAAKAGEELARIISASGVVELSQQQEFGSGYIEAMNF